ncbi:MAG: isoaspartyl peptidase/L-asparaginase [Betaproteobacteria bacterium]|nr:isoaspartyl peptidase/L-asparaginase [Betaproteobacteria bacterium]
MARRTQSATRIVLAVHGGAGTMSRADLAPRREAQRRAALERALRAGYEILEEGGPSIDAVAAAVVVLEDTPLFNAGRGAVFNAAGEHELDAAIMDGARLRAGAVAGVRRARNPILLARAVMERTMHVLLAGAGADRFAREQALPLAPPGYFSTRPRLAALRREKLRRHGKSAQIEVPEAEGHGTVGAVALDRHRNLAAATSTGGYTNKMAGRVGDSPIVGAGIYADNTTCAVSATGHGEFFMRAVLCYDLAARMRYLGEPLRRAAARALARVAAMGGAGGLIALDRCGRLAMPFTTEGMYRGYVTGSGKFVVRIYRERRLRGS